MENRNESTVDVKFSPITIDKVEANQYDASKFQAQVRQVVTRSYKQSGSDSLSDSLFGKNEFGAGQSYDENRVAWIPVPAEKATVEAVTAQLAKFPKAKIMRFLALKPTLSEEQLKSMESGINTKTVEEYMTSQAIPGVEYKGYAVTRVCKFVTTEVADIDNRERDYISMTGDVTEATEEFQMGTAVAAPVNAPAEKF